MNRPDGLPSLNVVLLDLDGVVRHFDPVHLSSVERSHGLEQGTLTAAAFESELIHQVITGRMTRSAWVSRVGEAVGSAAAAEEWMSNRGSVDAEMMVEVDRLRAAGITVAILTNGTDTIPEEMDLLGLTDRFERIFNTAEIGYAKPDRRAFEYVSRELEIEPTEVFFTDDSPAKLAGALELGMTARVFEDMTTFRSHLREFGLGESA